MSDDITTADRIHAFSLAGLADVLDEVCRKHRLIPAQVLSRRRFAPFVRARHELGWRLVVERGLSTTQAGRLLDRDHSSIVQGMATHEKRTKMGAAA